MEYERQGCKETADICEENCVHCDAVCRTRRQMPEPGVTSEMSDFFKAFSDHTRIRILTALSKGELCVCDISELLGMTQSAISHQLRFLKGARLVKNRKDGKTVYYSLSDAHIETILAQGMEHVQEG